MHKSNVCRCDPVERVDAIRLLCGNFAIEPAYCSGNCVDVQNAILMSTGSLNVLAPSTAPLSLLPTREDVHGNRSVVVKSG